MMELIKDVVQITLIILAVFIFLAMISNGFNFEWVPGEHIPYVI